MSFHLMPSCSVPRLVCRPALASDTLDVLEFTKLIWEGEDYIKYVWQDWLHDPCGVLAIAQYGSHGVGMAKVSFISPGQWWLEGLRVDPAHQGLKIASHLHEYTNGWWLENGDGVVRLMTSSERVQVHHLCERTGYARIGEVISYRSTPIAHGAPFLESASAQAQAAVPAAFQPVIDDQVGPALVFASEHLEHSNGLMDSGWRFSAPDHDALSRSIAQGHLHWWRGRQGLLSTFEDEQDGEPFLAIGFAAITPLSSLSQLLRDATDLASQRGCSGVCWLAPAQERVQAALRDAGYATDWEHTGFLYARPHPRG
jgi:GNAT superfamily N-acetyltransferase